MNSPGPGAQRQAARLKAKAEALSSPILSLPTRQQRRQKVRQADRRHLYTPPRPPRSRILADYVVEGVNYMFHATKGLRTKRVEYGQ